MSRIYGRAVAALVTTVFVLGLVASPAYAHEGRHVGAYEITVGWAHEPTYAGVENDVQVFIKDAKGKPVNDLGDPPSLQVEVLTGSAKSDPLRLTAAFDPDSGEGTPGEFDASIIPTRAGEYTFHLIGSIGDQKVDERFTSSDKTFDPVREPTEAEFPAKDPSTGQLATSIDRLNPRVDSAASAARAGSRAAKNAADKANTAMIVAVIALVVGVLAGGAGVALGSRRRS